MFDHRIQRFIPYLLLITFLALSSVFIGIVLQNKLGITETIFFQVILLGSMLFVGYYIQTIAPVTAFPSYVWAILAGMAMQPLLMFFNTRIIDLSIVISLCGALLFFTIGLEIPTQTLKKWFLPIASLSVLGLIVSAMGFATIMYPLFMVTGVPLSSISALIILSAALASVDPSGIMNSVRMLHLKKNKLVQLDDSLLTDISGTVFTRILLIMLVSVHVVDRSLWSYSLSFFAAQIPYALAVQLIVGLLVGIMGFFILKNFYQFDEKPDRNQLVLGGVPLLTLGVANAIAGAGLLAAFVSGLLANLSHDFKKISPYYDQILQQFIKPFIFLLLGSLTPVSLLLAIAPLGILIALIFIFILRPLVSFISLFPWILLHRLTTKEVLFLSFMRETGVVTAMLLIIAYNFHMIDRGIIVAIGTWVLLVTHVIEPPFIPYLASRLGLAKQT